MSVRSAILLVGMEGSWKGSAHVLKLKPVCLAFDCSADKVRGIIRHESHDDSDGLEVKYTVYF